MHWRIVMILSLFATPALAQDSNATARGRELTRLFHTEKLDSLWVRMSPALQQGLGGIAGLRAFRTQISTQLGVETKVVSEVVTAAEHNKVYQRTVHFEKLSTPIVIQWSVDTLDRAVGFFIRPAAPATEAPSKYLEYQTKTTLRLPFDREWFVVWGGRTIPVNYHAATVDQRFAYDLLIVKDSATHSGDGKRNEDYYCFGSPILSPGSGTVTASVDSVADNVPGVLNPRQAMGNYIIIDHGQGEFSVLAHFKRASIKVRTGDRVAAGTPLGSCGNSGNSSEAHLHYHLQDSGMPFQGMGMPAQFLGYTANGQMVPRGEPVKGEVIRP